MNWKPVIERLHRPVRHTQFWGPGLVILSLGVLSLTMHLALGAGEEFLKSGILGVIIGLLLLFRTKLGTTLYFCLLFGSAVARYERGFDIPNASVALQQALGLIIFLCLVSIGWEQVGYHFSRSQRV